jgi:hypothetical protein
LIEKVHSYSDVKLASSVSPDLPSGITAGYETYLRVSNSSKRSFFTSLARPGDHYPSYFA